MNQTREIFLQKKLAPISRLVLDNRVLNPGNRFYCSGLDSFRLGFAENTCSCFQVSFKQSGYESG